MGKRRRKLTRLPDAAWVKKAAALAGYHVRMEFSDGAAGIADLSDLINKSALFSKCRGEANFSNIAVNRYGHHIYWRQDPRNTDIDVNTLYAMVMGYQTPEWTSACFTRSREQEKKEIVEGTVVVPELTMVVLPEFTAFFVPFRYGLAHIHFRTDQHEFSLDLLSFSVLGGDADQTEYQAATWWLARHYEMVMWECRRLDAEGKLSLPDSARTVVKI